MRKLFGALPPGKEDPITIIRNDASAQETISPQSTLTAYCLHQDGTNGEVPRSLSE